MKHTIRITTILGTAAFAACFGAGPEPAPPTIAKILLSVGPQDSSSTGCMWKYFGNVAWGDDVGYVTIIPYVPFNCDGGAAPPDTPIDVFQFPKTGGAPTKIGSAGRSGGMSGPITDPPLVVATSAIGSGVIWAFSSTSGSGLVTVSTVDQPSLFSIAQADQPLALHAVADSVVVVTAPGGRAAINYPDFPCCQGMLNGMQTLTVLGASLGSSLPSPYCGYANHCIANNSTSLFYFESQTPPSDVRSVPLPGFGSGSGQVVGTTPTGATPTPAGLVADDANLVWATVPSYQDNGNFSGLGCLIQHLDLATGKLAILLDTTKFTCMDLALADNKIYFVITSITPGDSNNGGGNNNNMMRGDGIGRIDLGPGHDFESISLGFIGGDAGPRRVHVDATSIYAVDSHVIGSIPKGALDNRHDFSAQ
jgi:hypothetical protein